MAKPNKNPRDRSRRLLALCALIGASMAGLAFLLLQPRESESPPNDASQIPRSDAIPSPAARQHVLRAAAQEGRLQTVRTLLDQGTDANGADENGRTALMLAAFDGHTEPVRLLLDQGARIDARDHTGRTALMYAASGPHDQTVRLLLARRADPDIADRVEGWTALMFAAAEGQTEVVRALLEHGADATLQDADGETAQDFARNNGHPQIAQMLEAHPK